MIALTIDPEFQVLIPPLTAEEQAQLEANLLEEGCREALVVWQGEPPADAAHPCQVPWVRQLPLLEVMPEQVTWLCPACGHIRRQPYVLLDGHHRYAICQAHALPFKIVETSVKSRQDAVNWIITNQLARRNLTPEQISWLRGKRYNLEKQQGERTDLTSDQNDQKLDTAQVLADEYQVGRATIVRDGQFAEAVDALETCVRQDIRQAVLKQQSREDQARLTKQQVIKAGKAVLERRVEPLPFMQRAHWKEYHVLEAIEYLGSIPKEEHGTIDRLLDQSGIPPRDALRMIAILQVMPTEERQKIYHLHDSADSRERSLALTRAIQYPPQPDPQIFLLNDARTALSTVRKRVGLCLKRFPQEPWTDRLQAIRAQCKALYKDVCAIQAEANAKYQALKQGEAERVRRTQTTELAEPK